MIRFINCFQVPVGREEEFMTFWLGVNTYMKEKPGYIRHELHRSLTPDATYRYVNVAEWDSAENWRNAHDAGFRARVSTPEAREFPSLSALYEIVHEGRSAVGDHPFVGSAK